MTDIENLTLEQRLGKLKAEHGKIEENWEEFKKYILPVVQDAILDHELTPFFDRAYEAAQVPLFREGRFTPVDRDKELGADRDKILHEVGVAYMEDFFNNHPAGQALGEKAKRQFEKLMQTGDEEQKFKAMAQVFDTLMGYTGRFAAYGLGAKVSDLKDQGPVTVGDIMKMLNEFKKGDPGRGINPHSEQLQRALLDQVSNSMAGVHKMDWQAKLIEEKDANHGAGGRYEMNPIVRGGHMAMSPSQVGAGARREVGAKYMRERARKDAGYEKNPNYQPPEQPAGPGEGG